MLSSDRDLLKEPQDVAVQIGDRANALARAKFDDRVERSDLARREIRQCLVEIGAGERRNKSAARGNCAAENRKVNAGKIAFVVLANGTVALERERDSERIPIKLGQRFGLRGVDDKTGQMEGFHE